MKYIISIFFLSICFLNVPAQSKVYKNNQLSFDSLLKIKGDQSKGKLFPFFKLVKENVTIDNKIFLNKVTYINFWFKSCPPCIAEMSALNELYNKMCKKKSFQFISFTFESAIIIDQMRKKYHIKYPVYSISKNECYRLNQDSGFPTSIIVDKKGLISFLLSGYTTNPIIARSVLMEKVKPEIDRLF